MGGHRPRAGPGRGGRARRRMARRRLGHPQRRRWGQGPRSYDWAWVPIRPLPAPGKGYWLLARRSRSDPTELAYDVGCGPAATTLPELVRVAGTRWTIETCLEEAKGEVGLDEYEVRRWDGWHRHVTLCLLAHAVLAVTRGRPKGGRRRPADGGAAAADGAGGAAPAADRLARAGRDRACLSPGVVALAATAPSTGQTQPLPPAPGSARGTVAAAQLNKITPAVVLRAPEGCLPFRSIKVGEGRDRCPGYRQGNRGRRWQRRDSAHPWPAPGRRPSSPAGRRCTCAGSGSTRSRHCPYRIRHSCPVRPGCRDRGGRVVRAAGPGGASRFRPRCRQCPGGCGNLHPAGWPSPGDRACRGAGQATAIRAGSPAQVPESIE